MTVCELWIVNTDLVGRQIWLLYTVRFWGRTLKKRITWQTAGKRKKKCDMICGTWNYRWGCQNKIKTPKNLQEPLSKSGTIRFDNRTNMRTGLHERSKVLSLFTYAPHMCKFLKKHNKNTLVVCPAMFLKKTVGNTLMFVLMLQKKAKKKFSPPFLGKKTLRWRLVLNLPGCRSKANDIKKTDQEENFQQKLRSRILGS